MKPTIHITEPADDDELWYISLTYEGATYEATAERLPAALHILAGMIDQHQTERWYNS